MNDYKNDYEVSLGIYYNELKKYKPLEKEEEKELLIKAKNGDEKAKNKIIAANLRFVFDTAKKYRGKGVSMPDLVAEGNLGIMRAIDKFDINYDVKFFCYAVWWIKQAMLSAIKNAQERSNYEKNNDDEIKNEFEGILDDINDDTESQMSSDENLENDASIKDTREMIVDKLMVNLKGRDRYIIEQYYGLNGEKSHTLNEIGKSIGKIFGKRISSERVRQIKKKILFRLKSEALCMENRLL